MSLFEAVRLALGQLRVQKLKSFFTVLGVTIGVMFLIAVVSIAQGINDYMRDDFAGRMLGVNTFTLRSRANFSDDGDAGSVRSWNRRPPIFPSDIAPVRAALPPGVRFAAQSADFQLRYATSQYARPRQITAMAVEGEYFTIKNYELSSGRVFMPQEAQLGTEVVVIGDEVATYFFPNLDPIDRDLTINGYPFRVIGVIKKQGSLFGFSLDRMAIAPLKSRMGVITNSRRTLNGILVQAASPAVLADAQEAVREVMRSRHQLRPADPDDFTLETSASALAAFQKIMTIIAIAGSIFPFIGLVVGGMVIMNIMLVAVAERTREIGIRKALGAKRRDILRQFVVEAATLSTLGAIVGIALGIAAARVVAWKTPLPAGVAYWSIVAATLLGTVVGIVAGVYPASRASRLDPIEALRQEL